METLSLGQPLILRERSIVCSYSHTEVRVSQSKQMQIGSAGVTNNAAER